MMQYIPIANAFGILCAERSSSQKVRLGVLFCTCRDESVRVGNGEYGGCLGALMIGVDFPEDGEEMMGRGSNGRNL